MAQQLEEGQIDVALMLSESAIARVAAGAPMKIVGTYVQSPLRWGVHDGTLDVWFWEKFTTKHLVDSGEWDILGEVPTPWSCFVFVASENAIAEKGEAIRSLVETTKGVYDKFKANTGGKTAAYASKNHAFSNTDAEEGFAGTQWACDYNVNAVRHALLYNTTLTTLTA